MTPDACLICGGGERAIHFSYDVPDAYEQAVGVPLGGYRREWAVCSDCGFHYARYSRDASLLERIYEDAYRDEKASWRGNSVEETFERVIALPYAESENKQRVKWIKDAVAGCRKAGLIHWREAPWPVLDIGGATGIFAYEFQDEHWSCKVVDPAVKGDFISSKLGIPYVRSSFRSGLFEGAFNLITLIYALEHLPEPDVILEQVRDDLVPEGALYIEVPDAVAFDRKRAEDDIFNSCHLWMFDPISIVALLRRQGFELLQLQRSKSPRGHYSLSVLAKVLA